MVSWKRSTAVLTVCACNERQQRGPIFAETADGFDPLDVLADAIAETTLVDAPRACRGTILVFVEFFAPHLRA
jgi:hypothetical protein